MKAPRNLLKSVLALCLLSGCTLDVRGRKLDTQRTDPAQTDFDAPASDGKGGVDAADEEDAGDHDDTTDSQADAGAATQVDETPDANGEPYDPAADAAVRPPASSAVRILDGVSTQGEWDDATSAQQQAVSNWGADRNALRALSAVLDEGFLWLRVEGAIEVTNAITVYVDSVPHAGISPSNLTDRLGTVDDAISCGVAAPAAHFPDVAWGTRVVDGDGALVGAPGWRTLSSTTDLGWIEPNEAPSVCNRGVCETRISRKLIGSTGPVYIFARLVNGTGDLLSNQGLPSQPSANTDEVTEIMLVRDL